jgi:hypothetical protein
MLQTDNKSQGPRTDNLDGSEGTGTDNRKELEGPRTDNSGTDLSEVTDDLAIERVLGTLGGDASQVREPTLDFQCVRLFMSAGDDLRGRI